MRKNIFNKNILYILIIAIACSVNFTSCKTKKKVTKPNTELQAELRKKNEAKRRLRSLLNNKNMSSEKMTKELNSIIEMNVEDNEINSLVSQVKRKIEEKKKKEIAAATKVEETDNTFQELFQKVANDKANADKYIKEAINLCESENTPVLIIISSTAKGVVDYDRPTTVLKYMQYLKDTKNVSTKVHNVIFNDNGKIKEIELKKK